tara:strand:- start:265 stop:477 length:213 start_codon:yes stop_codon:yes gene_type:complete
MKYDNDFLVYNEGFVRWSDDSLVIYSFIDGQSEEEIRADHELQKDDIIVYANTLKGKIKTEFINQIMEKK